MKRCLVLMLCLALCATAASAETFCVGRSGDEEVPGYFMLLRDDGTPLTAPDAYPYIYEITPEGTPEAERRFAAELPPDPETVDPRAFDGEDAYLYRRMVMLDAQGRQVSDFGCVYLDYGAPGQIVFTQSDGLSGVIDADGQVLLEARYASVACTDSGWLAVDPGSADIDYDAAYPVVYIGRDGETRDTGLHAPAGGLRECAQGITALNGALEGGGVYLDSQGAPLFEARFTYAGPFCGAIACVERDGLYGLIDQNGSWVAPCEYEDISQDTGLTGEIYIARKGGRVTVFDSADGSVLFDQTFEGDDIYAGTLNPAMLNVVDGERSRIYGLDGALLAELDYENNLGCWFSQGCEGTPTRFIENFGEWPFDAAHLVDLDLNPVGPDFQGLSGLAWRGDRGLYLTSTCRITVDADGDYAPSYRTWRYGLCDQGGNTLLDPLYESIELLSEDRLWVTGGSAASMIDFEGNVYYTVSNYDVLID